MKLRLHFLVNLGQGPSVNVERLGDVKESEEVVHVLRRIGQLSALTALEYNFRWVRLTCRR